jgi:uncharacterized protein (DUF1015 family)
MVEIKPFKGITYNTKKFKEFDDIMSPPYDIISKSMQEELYKKNPYNFVRLILGKQYDNDTADNNRYSRAKNDFDQWLSDEILIDSKEPAIYPYQITYNLEGKEKTMKGFFTILKLDKEYKLVKAHEHTLSKPKADRLNLMRSCKSNLEPIQLLYMDKKDKITKSLNSVKNENPLIRVNGYDNFIHEICKITDESVISSVQNQLKDEILFIADGHHRYQTAINYANEVRKDIQDADENAPYNYRMVILVNMFDEGLAILPTHRLITVPLLKRKEVLDNIAKFFTITEHKIDKSLKNEILVSTIKNQLKSENEHKFALFFKDEYYILTLKDDAIMDKIASDRSKTWKTLDVSILHKIIIEHIMGINQEILEDHIKYTRDDIEAISFVKDGSFDCSFLMNATKIEELKIIADGGEHMPQKSTYFLPKMLSGLVMYKME